MIVPAQIVVALLTISSLVHPIVSWLASPQPPQSLTPRSQTAPAFRRCGQPRRPDKLAL
jgi:hypothetical protein